MRIKELREARGLNQTRVAEAMGVSQVAVAKWEAGRAFPAGGKVARAGGPARLYH